MLSHNLVLEISIWREALGVDTKTFALHVLPRDGSMVTHYTRGCVLGPVIR